MKQFPINIDIVSETKYGRYPKISTEQCYNLIQSDNALVPFAGDRTVVEIDPIAQGRGIYTSAPLNAMIAVIGNVVYMINVNLFNTIINYIDTYLGDVYIAENNSKQIAICDGQSLYIYDYELSTFTKITLNFQPGYVNFQNSRFLISVVGTNSWRLSVLGKITGPDSFPFDTQHVGYLETKPDVVIAPVRFPGRGNMLFLFGQTVAEAWQDVGSPQFPYQRSSAFNIDYGCINPSTIAYNENMIVWISINEKSGPCITYSDGGDAVRLSNDGIDYRLSKITNFDNVYGFLFRQDGHLIYQVSFPDDNVTVIYDFNTKVFFSLCSPDMKAHPAKQVAFFNGKYYFVSFEDGNIHELSSDIYNSDGVEIPRIIVTKNLRLPDASRFILNSVSITMEQGVTNQHSFNDVNYTGERLMLAVSKNGGYTFGNYTEKQIRPLGKYKNMMRFFNLGFSNDFVLQFRFYGLGRLVIIGCSGVGLQ